MKIVIAGGTGFIGGRVIPVLAAAGHEVVVLTRGQAGRGLPHEGVRFVGWDARTSAGWASELEDAAGVINLAGASIGGKRWTNKQKRIIADSRILATKALVDSMVRVSRGPRVFISASGVGYYGNVDSGEVSESHPPGNDFLAAVCRNWEEQAVRAGDGGARVVILRQGLVLGTEGGALPRLMLPFRFLVGGYPGTGGQWFPWVHADDVAGVICHAIEHQSLSGAFNVVAPEVVTTKEFCRALGRAMSRPSWTAAPAFLLRVALGEMADTVLTGQCAVPWKLLESGYRFRHPKLAEALASIMKGA